MDIKKFEGFTLDPHKDEYYVVELISGGDEYAIPDYENEYERNYNRYSLKSCVKYILEYLKDSRDVEFKIKKVKEEYVNDEDIEKIKKMIIVKRDAKKYNL